MAITSLNYKRRISRYIQVRLRYLNVLVRVSFWSGLDLNILDTLFVLSQDVEGGPGEEISICGNGYPHILLLILIQSWLKSLDCGPSILLIQSTTAANKQISAFLRGTL